MSATAPAAPATAPHRIVVEPAHVLSLARDVLATEANAITELAARLGADFVAAVELILNCEGRVVVSGIGKSGHIARKLAATLASTGTPAFFVHPAEASHGDLGMITRRRCRRDAVELRRDRRAPAADAAPEAPGREDRRADRQRAVVDCAGRRCASRRRGRRRGRPARSRADGQHDGHARAGRCARARAARRARLFGRGLRPVASGRPHRAAALDARARRDGERQRAADRRHRRDARRSGGHDERQGHGHDGDRGRRRTRRRHLHRRRSSPLPRLACAISPAWACAKS